jgi:adenylate kinase
MSHRDITNQTSEPIYLIFLGPPGSGKGTQADKLRDRYGLFHLSSGELFREHIARRTELGLKVKDILARGALVPDDLTVAMVMERVREPDTERGVVFDGFPRTREQALALQRELAKEGKQITRAIYFHVDDEVVIERLAARRVCPKDGATYNLKSKPPRQDEVCDNDETRLIQRDDDRPEVVQKRLEVYRELTEPLIGLYEEQDLLSEIHAAQDIDTLEAELDEVIDSLVIGEGNKSDGD